MEFMNTFKNKVGLLLCGSIAVSRAKQVYDELSVNYDVKVAATKAAEQIYANEFGKDIYFDLFNQEENQEVNHIKYFKDVQTIIVYAATYNTINKFANGINDDFILSSLSAFTREIIFVPAMNDNMWTSEILQANITKIKETNARFKFIDPIVGRLREGSVSIGHVADTDVIVNYVNGLLAKKILAGKKIVIASGAMQASIDKVRVLTNKSSGKFAYEFATQMSLLGAEVTWLDNSNYFARGVNKILVNTNEEMINESKKYISDDVIYFSLTAGSDFKVENILNDKISSDNNLTLQLVKDVKILEKIREYNSKFKLVAFKLSDDEMDARNILEKYKCDYVFWNNLDTIGSQNVIGKLISNNNEVVVNDSKSNSATKIINEIFGSNNGR